MKRTITFLMFLLTAGAAMAQGEFVCGDTVRDGSGNAYATVQIGALCWTTSNMRAVSYADGTPIAKAMIYNSERYNDTVANLANFGRLYTWWSAVNVPEGDDTKPAKDTAGFVQGVCPEGWHIPTVGEMNDLRSVPEEDLHSTDFWVLPNANTNSTGFSEVPGGKFSAELDRFEGLYTNSYMWTDSATSSEWVVACNSRYFCDKASEESIRKGDALSVRCVMVSEICSEVLTLGAIDTTEKRIRLKGSITDLAGTVENSGFVWGLSNTAITNTVNSATRGADIFSLVEGVNPCDTIWYAAFAKTSMCTKTIYGDTLWFVNCCQSCPGIPTVADHEGNVYNTVLIGNQCWTKENMRCKTSPNRYLEYHNTSDSLSHHERAYYYDNPSSTIPLKERGFFYNWPGALDTISPYDIKHSFSNRRGICPEGWHIPSDEEWTIMENFVKSQSDYGCGSNENIAKALSSKEYWKTSSYNCAVGNEPNQNNASCFSIIPAGHTLGTSFRTDSISAFFWTSTSGDGLVDGYYRYFGYYDSTIKRDHGSLKYYGFSVRCLKDSDCPEVSTIAPDECNVSDTEATLKGKATRLKGDTEDHGFIWGTSKNNMTNTLNGTNVDTIAADGTFAAKITNMPPCGDTLYYMAYVKQSLCDETVYGDTMQFIVCGRGQDAKPCLYTPTVTDHEGNVYNTVQIGTQCWTKENMRCKTSPNGYLTKSDTGRYLTPHYYDNELSPIPLVDRGLFYNYAGVIDTIFSDTTQISGSLAFKNRRGICPEGWHLPSDFEWKQLLSYVNTKNAYICTGEDQTNYTGPAKALSSKLYWIEDYKNCTPGYLPSDNNATGFSAVPSGLVFLDGDNERIGLRAIFRSSTKSVYTIFGGFAYVNASELSLGAGYSVRCLRDACEDDIVGENCPTVTTGAAAATADGDVTVGGQVSNLTGTVEANGFAYGENKADLASTVANASGSNESLSAVITAATPCDTIWYAAFAKTSDCDDYVYGDTLMFITPAAAPDYTTCGTLTDIDGNVYATVKIGEQCWMAENLRVTKYADGTALTDWTANSTSNIGFTTRAYFAPNGDANNVSKYGLLYSWAAATNATNTTSSGSYQTWENYEGQGICPAGWHVPSDAEWTTLTDYVRDNLTGCLCDNTAVGKALASATDWKSGGAPTDASWSQQLSYNSNWGECSIGWPSTTDLNNITGFNAYPAGNWNYEASTDGFFKFGEEAMFWTSTLYGTTHNTYGYNNALKRTMYYYRKDVESGNYYQLNTARSVRCLKDTAEQNSTSVNTVSVCNIGVGSALVSAAVLNDGNIVETERGVCYGVSQNPTVQDSKIIDDSTGIGEYSCVITGLTAGTKYYIRAYALNSTGVFYGEQMEYTALSTPNGDAQACLEAPTLTDYDGNVYNTVKIGAQCWMKENLRTTHFADGTAIKAFDSFSDPEPWYSGGSDSVFAYNSVVGFDYNMAAIMNGDDSSNDNPSGVRGVCPIGWHVPSKSEWEQLFKYIGSQEVYNCSCGLPSNFEYYIAKALASNDESWVARDSFYLKECYPYLNTNANNSAGFSAVADRAIMYVPHGFSRTEAIFASSTKGSAEGVLWVASIDFSVDISDLLVSDGVSVRCVKDSDTCNVSDGSPCPNAKTVTDIDGITYNTVKIGEQCWMKENLRTKHFADGQEIEIASSDDDSRPTCWFPNGDENNVEVYGLLYNRIAAMNGISASYANPSGIQGVCPDGWHVPSYTEWYQLYNYVGSIPSALCSADTSKYIGKSLASKTGWLTVDEGVCNVGFNADGNNFTGFSAMPAGEQLSSASNFRYYSFGRESEIWSTTRELDYIGRGYYAGLVNNRPDDIMWRSIIGNQGLSVRCLKDDGCDCNTQTELPTVITSSHVSNINIVAADGGGFVSSQGSSSVTERGVCWSTSHNPTVTDNRTTDGNGAGRFTSYINYLTQGTTYYIRAYATNSSGTAYGREVEYTVPSVSSADGKPCPGTPTVTDHEGNVYNTVQIGTQCWTKENLRTTTSPSTGKYIVAKTGSILTTAGKMARWYNNDSVTYAPKNYGLLYNYNAAVDTFDVQFDETSTDTTIYKNIQFPKNSIRRGICPEGWHIPSVSEWGTLRVYTGYLRGNQENGYRCGIHDDGGAKALASTDDWLDYTDSDFPCAVGYHKEDNNSSGFSALPVGQCDDLSTGYNYIGTFRLIREHTSFWYLIEKNVTVNHYWLANDRGGFYAGGGMRLNELHPVRCLKDN